MKDWRAIAKASGIEIAARDMERIAQALDGLENAFRPLVKGLAPGDEPSAAFPVEEDSE